MITRICLSGALCASLLFPAGAVNRQKNPDNLRADSMVYDQPTQWRIFNCGGPVTSFAVQKDLLWFSNESGVASMGRKKMDTTKYPKLGLVPSTEVAAIVVDGEGKIWIGGGNGLVCKGEKDKDFTSFTKGIGLADSAVTALAATPGAVWVGTASGVACFRGGVWKTFTTENGLPSNKIQCMTAGADEEIWCGTDKGIGEYNGGGWTVHNMKKGMSWNDTKAISFDQRKNTVWAAVGEKDVNCFDGKTWTQYAEIQPGITSIMIDSQSRVWIGSMAGLQKFNGDDWINDPKQLGIPAALISKMFKDEAGNLWYGMESGVLCLTNPYPF